VRCCSFNKGAIIVCCYFCGFIGLRSKLLKDQTLPEGLSAWTQSSAYGLKVRGFASHDRGKPLIHFLHGNGMSGLTYWPMLRELHDDFDFLITDVQGHGDSDSGERFLGWNKNAEICTRVLKHHLAQSAKPNRPVYGLAHSLGAVLTTLMVAENPGLFSKSVLLDPVYFPRGMLTAMAGLRLAGLLERMAPLSRKAQRRRTQWPSNLAATNYLRERGVFKNWHEEALKSFVLYAMDKDSHGQVSLKCPNWIEAKFFGTYPLGLWRAIKRIDSPMHLLMAEKTFPFASKSANRALAINTHFSQQKVMGEHCFMQEYPSKTAQLVKSILIE
jgi:pimeloyl-ACP methyl ester carboxylesterase